MAWVATEIRCKGCAGPFTPDHHLRVFCSTYCRDAHYARAHPEYQMDACPDCGRIKRRSSGRCRKCADRLRQGANYQVISPAEHCPFCGSAMRVIDWHGRELHHCNGCGLETTRGEMKRIALEAALVEEAA